MTDRERWRRIRLEIGRSKRASAIVVAAIVVTIVAAGSLLSRSAFEFPWQQARVLRVAVDNAKGVTAGKNELRWAGVPVGTITEVQPRPGGAVLVTRLDADNADRVIYRDARVRLRAQTALADMYLDIERRGTPAAGRLEPDETLAAARTRTPVDVAEVLNVFSEDTREHMRQMLADVSTGLEDNGAALRDGFVAAKPWLQSIGHVAAVLDRRRTAVASLTHNLRLLTEEVGTREATLTGLVRDGARSLEALSADGSLGRLLAELPSSLRQVRTSMTNLATTASVLRPAVVAVEPAVRRLPAALRALHRFSATARPALRALRPAVGDLRPLARALRPLGAALDPAFERVGVQVPRMASMVAQLNRCRDRIEAFPTATIQTFKLIAKDTKQGGPRGNFIITGEEQVDTPFDLPRLIGCADGEPAPRRVPEDATPPR